MFNLLMQYSPWEGGRGTVTLSRLFEYTEDAVADMFRGEGSPMLTPLAELPCLFMREGTGNQVAHVGTISHLRVVGRDIAFEYAFSLEVPSLLNHMIFANRADFDIIHDYEFSRTHWAIKDVDLYRVLLRLVRPRRQSPTLFAIPEHEQIEPQLASVMMPFDAGFAAVYESVRDAATAAGFHCRRADEIWEAPAIIQDIVSLIDRSGVVICDCTGRNPNVFYEIGIAHTLGREVVLVSQNASDIPFDLRHLRYLPYLNNAEGREALSASLAERLRIIANR